jgi:hypothetical protein
VKVFFDTSVLVAASEQGHPHYRQALPALRRVTARRDQGYMSVHSIADMYAALTRLPVQPRIHPAEAVRIISDNILPHFETVPVGKKDYTEALRLVGDGDGAAQRYTTHCSSAARPDRKLIAFTPTLRIFGNWGRIWKRKFAHVLRRLWWF